MKQQYFYLALGDSYTIGEQLSLWQTYPYQLVQELRSRYNINIEAPELIAKSGFTCSELQQVLDQYHFRQDGYDFVTLLMGVNNQYRNHPIEQFEREFEIQLKFAIQKARGISRNVIVLSIPDWGVTKFARDKLIDSQKVSKEIDEYNSSVLQFTKKYDCQWIEITTDTRAAQNDESLCTPDGIHYSQIEITIWTNKIIQCLQNNQVL